MLAAPAHALQLTLRTAEGKPVADAVVGLVPATPPAGKPQPAVMGQRDVAFTPHVVAVQTGADVSFENSDTTRHHVYSFSPAKKFETQMPTGETRHIVFDKPGVVAVGCNIHDSMLGFLVVMDTPYLGVSNANGVVEIMNAPDGNYTAKVWHERSRSPGGMTDMPVRVWSGGVEGFNAILDLKPERRNDAVEHRAY